MFRFQNIKHKTESKMKLKSKLKNFTLMSRLSPQTHQIDGQSLSNGREIAVAVSEG